MHLSANQSYLPDVSYKIDHVSVKLFTNYKLSLFEYIDKRVANPNLRLILKGHGLLVDKSAFNINFIHLFEKELIAYKSEKIKN